MIDCYRLYFTIIILLSDKISILWGDRRLGGIFSPGPGFDSRHWQPVDTQGEEILFIRKLKQFKWFNHIKLYQHECIFIHRFKMAPKQVGSSIYISPYVIKN